MARRPAPGWHRCDTGAATNARPSQRIPVARIGQHNLDTPATWGARPTERAVGGVVNQRHPPRPLPAIAAPESVQQVAESRSGLLRRQ